MNPQHIDKLQPGPELDALVAEKVMGWKVVEIHEPSGRKVMRWLSDHGEGLGMYGVDDWTPSSDITLAWEVVEKIHNHGESFKPLSLSRATGLGEPFSKFLWEATFRMYPAICYATAETAPHAICLAALKATLNQTSSK